MSNQESQEQGKYIEFLLANIVNNLSGEQKAKIVQGTDETERDN